MITDVTGFILYGMLDMPRAAECMSKPDFWVMGLTCLSLWRLMLNYVFWGDFRPLNMSLLDGGVGV